MDGRILRATRTTSLAGNRECRRKESVSAQSRTMRCAGQKPPGDLRVYFHPKPPLGSFTKAMGPGRTDPSWHSGNTHGFCVTGGVPPIASEPTPSPRLWVSAPGATPARHMQINMLRETGAFKTGTFYFAHNRKFLLCLDRDFEGRKNQEKWYSSRRGAVLENAFRIKPGWDQRAAVCFFCSISRPTRLMVSSRCVLIALRAPLTSCWRMQR